MTVDERGIRTTTDTRVASIASFAIGISHLVIVVGLMEILGYPVIALGDTASLIGIVPRIAELFFLGFIPAVLLIRFRLVVPITLVSLGLCVAILAELLTPGPTVAVMDEHVLAVGFPVLRAYVEGWYIWLFGYLLGGLCEYSVRWPFDGTAGSPPLSDLEFQFPLSRRGALGFGFVVGVLHAAVIFVFGFEHEGVVASGLLLGWGVGGAVILGATATVLLARHRLVVPVVAFAFVVIVTGIEAVMATVGTPVGSYQLFWPVYVVVFLMIGLCEYVVRRFGTTTGP